MVVGCLSGWGIWRGGWVSGEDGVAGEVAADVLTGWAVLTGCGAVSGLGTSGVTCVGC